VKRERNVFIFLILFFKLKIYFCLLEIAIERLRYAIYNCQAIDGDETGIGMQAAAMGWEE